MSHTPTCFGYPLWIGLPKRIGKKHLRRGNMFRERLKELADVRIGDLVCGCVGLNSRLLKVEPVYVGVGRGKVLYDFDIECTPGQGHCSVFHCGVERPVSYEEAVRCRDETLAYAERTGKEHWFAKYRRDVMTILPDGSFELDLDLLKTLPLKDGAHARV